MTPKKPNAPTTVAECVSQERARRGWSAMLMAVHLETEPSVVRQIEAGKYRVGLKMAERIARVCRMELGDVLDLDRGTKEGKDSK